MAIALRYNFFGFTFYMSFAITTSATEPSERTFFLMLLIHLLTMIIIMALLTFYIINVFRNERVKKDMKILWSVVLFLGSFVAMPIYWYLYIWRDPKILSEISK
jgi:uncharacterized membrane protein